MHVPHDPPTAEAAEAERLTALRWYAVLDTPPEAAFDRLASLAARLFRAPVALVSLTDEHRQWFKARVGVDLQEIDNSLSFCPNTVALRDVYVVPDAAVDPRFADNPLVVGEPHLRFYAGAPLMTPDGHALGTVCVMDTAARAALTPDERATLQDLADLVVSELELRRALTGKQRSEQLRDASLQSALDAVIVMDGNGRIEEWNLAAERLFGWSRSEALGQVLGSLIIPEPLRDAHRRGMARYLESGERVVMGRRVEVPGLHRDGHVFPCELAITPCTVQGEQLFTAYLRDLTEVKAAQEALTTSHNLLQAVVEGVPVGVFVKDLHGRYMMINETGAAHIGRPAADILGQDDHALFPDVTASGASSRDRHVMTTGETLEYEVTDLMPDGTHRTFHSTKRVYRDSHGEILGLIGAVKDITERKAAEALVQERNVDLERRVRARTQDVEAAQEEMLRRLARAAELRDDATGEHIQRVAQTAAGLARHLGLDEDAVRLIEQAAPLHDLGKIGVPDAVLLKPGRLTPEEFELIKTHTLLGARLLQNSTSELVRAAHEIALTHHERWDGAGYPHGLAGEGIPLFGRIVAVADVLDALTSERPYKAAWTLDAAVREIQAQAGRQFDPQVVAALLEYVAEHRLAG
ncbi:HD domain-containing phosphohydrolase [Deinococcus ficus]|uniref:HD domain-containing phosphohydrolase n=1 Tax=Deinococcus ficus TaxID=317577 RepID=UPI0003B7242D|nr:HD domain-containing phosphohydrolase [Deinococcus ficus]